MRNEGGNQKNGITDARDWRGERKTDSRRMKEDWINRDIFGAFNFMKSEWSLASAPLRHD